MRYFLFTVALLASFGAAGQTIGPGPGGGSGTVTSVANPSIFGVTCSVASATTVPAITCTGPLPVAGGGTGAATLTGLLKGNGTSPFTAAVAGTDYISPAGGTFTGEIITLASATGGAGLNLPQGTAPTSPVNGDVWVTSAGMFARIAGTTVGPFGTSGSGCTFANPTATASDTAVNGSATTCMRSDAAPAVQKASSSAFGLVKVDNQTIVAAAGVISTSAPDRSTSSSPIVVGAGDVGGQINWTGSGAGTVSNFTTVTVPAGTSVTLCNQSSAALTLPTAPVINGYTAATLPAVSGGSAACINLLSNGTSLDAMPTGAAGSGSGTVNSGTIGQIGVYAATGTAISGQTVASGVILKGQGAAVPVASAITDNASNVSITEAALTVPVALTDGATIATNAALSNVFTVTLAGNRTLSNPTNLVAGQFITWQITQDATGSRALAFGANFAWMSGAAPLLNSTAAAKTTISCFVDTTSTLQCAGGAPLPTVTTGSNCSSAAAPAVCGSASGGSIAVPTGTNPTLTVNTTAVTANSQILMNIDESLGTKLSVTCNTTLTTLTNPVVTARTAGTSFTVQIGATIAVNPACVSYLVVN